MAEFMHESIVFCSTFAISSADEFLVIDAGVKINDANYREVLLAQKL